MEEIIPSIILLSSGIPFIVLRGLKTLMALIAVRPPPPPAISLIHPNVTMMKSRIFQLSLMYAFSSV